MSQAQIEDFSPRLTLAARSSQPCKTCASSQPPLPTLSRLLVGIPSESRHNSATLPACNVCGRRAAGRHTCAVTHEPEKWAKFCPVSTLKLGPPRCWRFWHDIIEPCTRATVLPTVRVPSDPGCYGASTPITRKDVGCNADGTLPAVGGATRGRNWAGLGWVGMVETGVWGGEESCGAGCSGHFGRGARGFEAR